MAKQAGIFRISGTLGGLTFYRMNGKDYVRRKSSLNRKRVNSDPAFARSRACSMRFGLASQLAKHIYRLLSPLKKRRYTIGSLTAAATRLLQQEYSTADAYTYLAHRYLGPSATVMLRTATDNPHPGTGPCLVIYVPEQRLVRQVSIPAAPV